MRSNISTMMMNLCVCVCFFYQFRAPVVNPEIGANEEAPSTSQGLSMAPPLVPATEPQLDLEQQWQDIMAIMELQVCCVFN